MLETDPIDLLLDTNHDLVIDTDLNFSSGLDGVAQGIKQRLLTFQSEWFLDLDHGVPYFQTLLGKKFDETKAREAFRDIIAESPGVTNIRLLNVAFNSTTRTLSVTWQTQTIFGETEVDTLEIA